MLKFSKNKVTSDEFKLDHPSHDFLPYACHFDDSTILSKNGELIQTVRIIGFSEAILGKKIDIRSELRRSLNNNIRTNDISLWFHTVRRKANLEPPSHYKQTFARDTHESWCNKNHWRDKYVNELYVTIIHKGLDFEKPLNLNFFKTLHYKNIHKKHIEYLNEAKKYLYKITNSILRDLKIYGATRLATKSDRIGTRSEILEFFAKILHLHEKRMDLPINDLSKYLVTGKTAFGDKAFQIVDDKRKFFGAIFTIKEFHEFSVDLLDGFLKLPQELIITQTMTFANPKKVKQTFKKLHNILSVSKDNWLAEKTGIQTIFDTENSPVCFGESQLTVTVISEHLDELDEKIEKTLLELNKLGLVVVREDLNMEMSFWSQFPGNFKFIKRKEHIHYSRMATFSSLYNSPKGKLENPWGNSVTLFRGEDGTPFFFNFHVEEVGHTLICGPYASGKTTLMNFLLSESSKYNPRIMFIDQNPTSRLLIKALGGKHYIIKLKKPDNEYYFNPLQLRESESNKNFLKKWLKSLLNEEEISNDILEKTLVNIYKLEKKERKLSNAKKFIEDTQLLKKLEQWCNDGKYSALFDNEGDIFDNKSTIIGFDISEIMQEDQIIYSPLILYLTHRFNISLDGMPSILLMNNAHKMLQKKYFEQDIEMWLDYLTSMNSIVIFMKEQGDIRQSSLSKVTPNKFSTLLLMPDQEAPERYIETLKLKNSDIEIVRKSII